MTRDLTHYRALPYKKTVWREEDEKGPYFMAEIKELPGCLADGDTRSEALFNLKDAFDSYIEVSLEVGRDIPEPKQRVRSASILASYTIRDVAWVGRPAKRVIVPMKRTPRRDPAATSDRWNITSLAEEIRLFATATAYDYRDSENDVTSGAEGNRVAVHLSETTPLSPP